MADIFTRLILLIQQELGVAISNMILQILTAQVFLSRLEKREVMIAMDQSFSIQTIQL